MKPATYALAWAALVTLTQAAWAQEAEPLTAEAINAANLATLTAGLAPPAPAVAADDEEASLPHASLPDPAVVRLQVLLDRAGSSPGAIDGFLGDNARKAVAGFELMHGLEPDGELDDDVIARLDSDDPVVGTYTIVPEDMDDVTGPVPDDYAAMAQLEFLGYAGLDEKLAERFHMDIDLLHALNPGVAYAVGETIVVAAYGPDVAAEVARIEADKSNRQVRAYDAEGRLVAAYPATIGSEQNPSPAGTHLVSAVAPMPNYTYNPDVNFRQGDNDSVLIIPPGPNGPVGSMWIDLTEPTFGIHGTPEPSLIDKVASHGCVRLTNWDANELAAMVTTGVPVEFLD